MPRTSMSPNCCAKLLLKLAICSFVFLGLTPIAGQLALAQQAEPSRPAPAHRAHTRATLDDRIRLFAKQLDLNEQQQAAVKRILEQRQMDTLRIRQDPSLSGEQRIARFRILQDQTVERIRAVLTDEQKKKYDPLAVRRIQPSPDQRSVDDWLQATKPKQ